MVTERQLTVNRENAKSGGVKTPAGKKITKLNAVTHGLLSKEVLFPGEDGEELRRLSEALRAELQPEGELETALEDIIVANLWRLKRVLHLETYYSREMPTEKGLHFVISDLGQNISRYETHIERQLYRAMHELERRQDARHGKSVLSPVAIDVSMTTQN